MRARLVLTAVLTASAVSAIAWGQEIVLNADPAHATVQFKLSATLHTVHGSFKLKRGAVRFNPATGKISGEIVVDAASGASGDDGRDRRMHNDILESARYPEISFTPDRVDGTVAPQGASQIQVHGLFRIHGAAHEIVIPVNVRIENGKASVKAAFAIPYVKWGMKNPSSFVLHVGSDVQIDAEIEAATGG
jgi:polyisoprenoid-binding protein YceI